MALLEIVGATKRYGSTLALDDLSLSVERGELLVLLGPSGCGKSTLLRLIAGLEKADAGTVTFQGEPLAGVPPERRAFGLMFQDLALFPHLSVHENIAFGLRRRRLPGAAINRRVGELLGLVNMPGYGARQVHQLSGGERQRVALARSLAPSPRLLMLDEPMGALDWTLREELYTEVRRILKTVEVASLYVTHDHNEAFAVADRIAVMQAGRIVQSGSAEEVLRAPASEFIARFLGYRNIFRGHANAQRDAWETEIGSLPYPAIHAPEAALLVPEQAVSLEPRGEGPTLRVEGKLREKVLRSWYYRLQVAVGRGDLFFLAPRQTADSLEVGTHLTLYIDVTAVQTLPADDGQQRKNRQA
ncbi:MAG: ABC transporter ATP-binding protein [Chloroflexi bacterium]|nr:ABC transporter ATP-binding protein [Chloroflexota bacterium]